MSRTPTAFLQDLLAWLQADAPIVAALVVSGRADGTEAITIDAAKQGDLRPRIVVASDDDPGHYHLGGTSSLRSPSLTVECWGRSSRDASVIADLVEARMDGFRGTFGGQNVRGTFRTARRAFVEERTDGVDGRNFAAVLEYDVWRFT